jgi:hypothetical protein
MTDSESFSFDAAAMPQTLDLIGVRVPAKALYIAKRSRVYFVSAQYWNMHTTFSFTFPALFNRSYGGAELIPLELWVMDEDGVGYGVSGSGGYGSDQTWNMSISTKTPVPMDRDKIKVWIEEIGEYLTLDLSPA